MRILLNFIILLTIYSCASGYYNHNRKFIRTNVGFLNKQKYFIYPLNKYRLTSVFGMRGWKKHKGIDLAAPKGTHIIASAPGRIILSRWVRGYGKTVIIQHVNNFRTLYAHMHVILKEEGYVKRGEVIGLVGSTGNSTGNHLHFEIQYDKIALDPFIYL